MSRIGRMCSLSTTAQLVLQGRKPEVANAEGAKRQRDLLLLDTSCEPLGPLDFSASKARHDADRTSMRLTESIHSDKPHSVSRDCGNIGGGYAGADARDKWHGRDLASKLRRCSVASRAKVANAYFVGDRTASYDSAFTSEGSTCAYFGESDDESLGPIRTKNIHAETRDVVRRISNSNCKDDGLAHLADREDELVEDWVRSKRPCLLDPVMTTSCCARLLSGKLVMEFPSTTKVFVARLQIARALRVGAPQVHLLSGFSSLDDNAILSDALADSVDKSMSVVVVKDLRRPQKILKAQALIALGQFSIARELLEGIGEAPEARSLLETAISSELTRPSRRIEIQQQLDLL